MIKKQIRKMQTAAGGPLQLTPEEQRYLEWSKMTPKQQQTYRINRAKAYFDNGQLWNAAKSYFGGFDPKNPHLNTGEAPSPGMRNPKQIIQGVQKAKSIAQRAAKISDKIFDRQYWRAINSKNPKRVQAVRNLHFSAKAPETKVVNIKGRPQLVIHKTPNHFTKFDNNRSYGKINWFATKNAFEGEEGVFATGAGRNPREMKLYVNIKNPHIPTLDEGVEPAYINEGEDGILAIVDNNYTNYFPSTSKAGKGFRISGGVDNPYALKSYNSITYDNNGNIIPISQRDNFSINDIRYKQGGKMNILEFLKNGSGIHIKEKNKGKFTSYCGGKVTDECIRKAKASGNPTLVKRATFAQNARRWKHKEGGKAFVNGVSILDSNPDAYKYVKKKLKKHQKGGKTSTWQKIGTGIGNFLNSDIIGLGTQLFGTISGTKKAADFSGDYDEATKANVKAMTEQQRAKNKKEAGIQAVQFISYLQQQNPDVRYGELDLQQMTQKIADSLYDPQEIIDYQNQRNAEKLKYMQAIQGSAGDSINWLDSLGGIASNFLNKSSNNNSNQSSTITPKLTTNTWKPSTSLSTPSLGTGTQGSIPDFSYMLNPNYKV